MAGPNEIRNKQIYINGQQLAATMTQINSSYYIFIKTIIIIIIIMHSVIINMYNIYVL